MRSTRRDAQQAIARVLVRAEERHVGGRALARLGDEIVEGAHRAMPFRSRRSRTPPPAMHGLGVPDEDRRGGFDRGGRLLVA